MANKNLILIISAEQAYIRNIQEQNFDAQNEILFDAISYTYLPLLNMFSRLEEDSVPFKVGLVLDAPLCTLLTDPRVQKQYIDFLDKRIAFGNAELERNANNPEFFEQAQFCLNQLKKNRIDFVEVYQENLIEQFRLFAQKGFLEIIPTAATFAYLPHYADLPEALNAQIEAGLYACRSFFGETGEGFFLPYLGWSQKLDRVLRSYGINYTIVDTRAILFAEENNETGIFSPLRTKRSLVLFARDSSVPEHFVSENGFSKASSYRSQVRDVGFESNDSYLKEFLENSQVRIQTGFKYWANGSAGNEKKLYNPEEAKNQAKQDALTFYEEKNALLNKAHSFLNGKDAILTCVFPAELLGQTWYEGILWLEELIRLVANRGEMELSLCREHIQQQFSLPKITPYPCAASGSGYAEDLLDSSNNWTMRYVRKATERMIDLTERFPSETGLKSRLLNIAAREVLLAQSSEWAKMIHDGQLPVFASDEFKKNILAFTTVFDSLASNTVSTEWLTTMEKTHPIFPWINYHIFGRKK